MRRLLAGVFTLFWTVSAHAAPAFVQAATNAVFSNTTVTTTLGSVVGSGGRLLVATICATGVTSLTSLQYNGAQNFTQMAAVATGGGNNCWGAYLPNATSGGTGIVAVAASSQAGLYLTVEEYSGVATSSPLDGTPTGTYTASNTAFAVVSAGSITTTVNGDLVWGSFYQGQGGGAASSVNAGFTVGFSVAANKTEWQAQGSAGAINPGFTLSGTPAGFDNLVLGAAFKAAATGCSSYQMMMGVGC